MTERTLRDQIATLIAEDHLQLLSDFDVDGDIYRQDPECVGSAYMMADAILCLLEAHTAAQPAPDAVAEAAKVLLAQPKKADSPFAEAFFIACAYLEDDPCGIETTNEIIETFLKTLAGEND